MLVEVTEEGLAPWRVAVRRAAKNVKDLREPFRALSKRFTQQEQTIIARQGIPKWKALAPATLLDRMVKGFGPRPILWRSGRLFTSLINPEHSQAIERIEKDTFERGTRVPYAQAHHFGRGTPQRRLLPPEQEFGEIAEELILEWVAKPLEG